VNEVEREIERYELRKRILHGRGKLYVTRSGITRRFDWNPKKKKGSKVVTTASGATRVTRIGRGAGRDADNDGLRNEKALRAGRRMAGGSKPTKVAMQTLRNEGKRRKKRTGRQMTNAEIKASLYRVPKKMAMKS
jgi:hypothetical protein